MRYFLTIATVNFNAIFLISSIVLYCLRLYSIIEFTNSNLKVVFFFKSIF